MGISLIFRLATSSFFERAAYFGLRAILVLYLTDSILEGAESINEALQLYSVFAVGVVATGVIGGLLGDLFLSNRRAAILGLILQIAGTIFFIVPQIASVYIGLGLLAIGTGLYLPNLRALYAKIDLADWQRYDARFMFQAFMHNLGAFVGVILCGFIGEKHSWLAAISIAVIFMLLSLFFLLFKAIQPESLLQMVPEKNRLKRRILSLVLVAFMVTVFWFCRGLDMDFYVIENSLRELALHKSMPTLNTGMFYVLIAPFFVFMWIYLKWPTFIKMSFAFAFTAAGILFGSALVDMPQTMGFLIFCLLLISLGELFITPLLSTAIVRNVHYKYLAIAFCVYSFPEYIIGR